MCTVCMRQYPSRTKLLRHLHEKMEVCLVNTILTMPKLSEDVVAEADRVQAAAEAKARAAGEHHAYTQALCGQRFGPMRRIWIPNGHPRRSTIPLLENHLLCPNAAREVDFDAVHEVLGEAPYPSDAVEELPMELLAHMW